MAKSVDISNIGQSRDVLQNKGNSPLNVLLNELMTDVVGQLKEAMDSRDVSASRGLRQSLAVTTPVLNGDELTVSITADSYWKYVNYGVNGTDIQHGAPNWGRAPKEDLSFKDAILKWIPERGLKPLDGGSYDNMSFAIMNGIKRDGKAPRPFLQDVVNDALVKKMSAPISKLLGRAITIKIVEPWR